MTRLAAGRTTHLERDEIAAEALKQFDEGGDPSIRQLATALNVTPSAIYHHYSSRAEIIQSAVEMVWVEILVETSAEVGNPMEADPFEVLVTVGLLTRRNFLKHFKITLYMTGIPRTDELSAGGIALFANAFERLGVSGEEAGDAFHYFANYCFGNALVAASRLSANQELGAEHPSHERLEELRREAEVDDTSQEETRAAIDAILDLSLIDPERDETLFVNGLRQILERYAKV